MMVAEPMCMGLDRYLKIDSTGARQYLLNDVLHSVRGVTSDSGAVLGTTNLWVAVDINNEFVAGWKLSQAQVGHLFSSGNIQ